MKPFGSVLFAAMALAAGLAGCAGGSEPVTTPDLAVGAPAPDLAVGPDAAAALCSAVNCAGCCFNDACQTGITALACGKGGDMCQQCSAPATCLADQSCGISPDKAWTLTIVGATIAPRQSDGSCWDSPCGDPDPYLTSSGLRYTATVQDTRYPAWNLSLNRTTQELTDGAGSIAMMDEDVVSDDTIAYARALKFSKAEIAKGAAEWTDWGQVLSIRFTIQPR